VSGVAQLLLLEGMVAQRCARATSTNGQDAHFTLDFRSDRQPFDRSEMDSRLLSELRVPSKVEGDACPTTTNRDRQDACPTTKNRDRQDACPTTILNHDRATTHSHLATSQSHRLTWLSPYHQPAGPSLNLTCRSFGTSRGWTLAIPSAGPVAGAGIPARGCRSKLDRRPACLLADQSPHKLADRKATREQTGKMPVQLFPAGNRRPPEVRIA